MNLSATKLSIIVTTRNDNHGGELLARTIKFVEGLIHQSNKFKYKIELIIVEWNPPADKPLLKEVLPIPQPNDFLELRFIVVPPSIHQKYRHADVLGLYQMTAKNVGIIRAKGEFILCTNIDILFSDACFSFLASDKLQTGNYYRNTRCDIPAEVLKIKSFDEQLAFAKQNIIKKIGGNRGYKYVRAIPPFFYAFPRVIKLLDTIWEKIEKDMLGKNRDIFIVDTEACGDFTLMSKQDWLKIEGYPELDLYSIHIDSMGVMAAYASGIKQVLLSQDECIYHIYHKEGWESFDTPIEMLKFTVKKPGLDWNTVFTASQYIYKNKRGWQLNKPDWGFANEQFEEHVFNAL